MIAVEWLRRPEGQFSPGSLSQSLSAGTARHPLHHDSSAARFAALRERRSLVPWRPALVGPWHVLFAGHLDNAASIAAELGLSAPLPGDGDGLARLYGAALAAWGPAADLRLIGEYATIALDAERGHLRLARSPLRAPPLHYHLADDRAIAASVPRAIFACGVPQQLDETKLADMAWFNASEEQRSWFVGLNRVPLGSTVEIERGGPARTRRYYDFSAIPRQPRASAAEYLEQANRLLAEGTRAALAGSSRPAVMLSGGLDSPLIALKVLEQRPDLARLNAYTIVPEPGWGGLDLPGRFTDERPLVEAFCRMHPRIAPQFIDNAEARMDDRLVAMFMAVGGAPQGLANLWTCHAAWDAARHDGCDRVLLGELGNLTVSESGSWGYSEYLLKLRWRQLYRALRTAPNDDRSLWRRFLALAVLPILPDRLWHWQERLRGRDHRYAAFSGLRPDYTAAQGVEARAIAAGLPNPRHPVRDRLATLREVHDNAWGEFSDIYHGFAQIHGIEQRDPTAYRPLVEFCAGLPTDMFLRDGQERWLARELLRGAMPEEQRLTTRTGRHNADWHAKIGRQREDFLRELDRLADNPRIAAMFDLDRARDALEDWPDSGAVSDAVRIACEVVVPRAIIMGRFVNYVEGRN